MYSSVSLASAAPAREKLPVADPASSRNRNAQHRVVEFVLSVMAPTSSVTVPFVSRPPWDRARHCVTPLTRRHALLVSVRNILARLMVVGMPPGPVPGWVNSSDGVEIDRKSTRLNSSHLVISYAV